MSNTDWLDRLEHILIKMGNDVLDLPKTNYPIGKPIDEARQAILAEIDKAIGEDEEDDLNPLGMMARSTATNRLRAELRTKLGIEKENKDE